MPQIFLPDESHTQAFAATWRDILAEAHTVYLSGSLGAGKTTFARGLLRGMGFTGAVKSPTYSLVESYPFPNGRTVHHFDLYRLHSPEEWDDAGLGELCGGADTCLIEWAQQGGRLVPPADLVFEFYAHGSGRTCRITAAGALGKRSLDLWQKQK